MFLIPDALEACPSGCSGCCYHRYCCYYCRRGWDWDARSDLLSNHLSGCFSPVECVFHRCLAVALQGAFGPAHESLHRADATGAHLVGACCRCPADSPRHSPAARGRMLGKWEPREWDVLDEQPPDVQIPND